jgi:hypothetical protein
MPAIPKRSTERRRTNKVPGLETATVTGKVRVPAADRDWHPIARDWYRSLRQSGQSRYYEPSDWQTARMLADSMSRMLLADDPNASMLNAIVQASRDLLTTEGQRRRLRLELTRETVTSDPAADAASADVDNIISLAVARA